MPGDEACEGTCTRVDACVMLHDVGYIQTVRRLLLYEDMLLHECCYVNETVSDCEAVRVNSINVSAVEGTVRFA